MKLTLFQRMKRRVSLWGGSYTHPDGTLELDIDEKAGIDPTVDSPEASDRKFTTWLRREQIRQDRWQHFLAGLVVGGLGVYLWLR
jgi:hypothetical protein